MQSFLRFVMAFGFLVAAAYFFKIDAPIAAGFSLFFSILSAAHV